ncbi:MAG: gamma-glutamyltransferase, partial [Kiloniellales bacterium]|nr:gamma-glutamyltransferase [Kiloniellales bacterium]
MTLYASQKGGGMVVAPHHLAAQAGRDVLAEGGNAIEAMVAAAAAISVVYPHMNGLGGDGFWLIHEPGRDRPLAISAIGAAGAGVTQQTYAAQGLEAIPTRGPLAANTSAGTVAGWQAALAASAEAGGRLPLDRLLEPAIHHAREGFPATESQVANTLAKREDLEGVPGWAEVFLPGGAVPAPGDLFKQPALAETLARLAAAGLEDFYRGDVARCMAADLARAGSPIGAHDLAGQGAVTGAPLGLPHSRGSLFNVPPPSQGLVSLILLGLFDRLDWAANGKGEDFAHIHGLVEATKRAFLVRNAEVTDPAYMTAARGFFLRPPRLDRLAADIDPARALPWPAPAIPGDTVWLASADADGRVVSFIHSIY